jgi:hypothetical protein
MKSETIVDLPGIVLFYYPEPKILHHQMRRYPGTEALESTLQKGLEVMQARGAEKWLSDDRRGGALPKSHHEWGEHVWGRRRRRRDGGTGRCSHPPRCSGPQICDASRPRTRRLASWWRPSAT